MNVINLKAERIKVQNNDLSVSNIARTSFDNWNEELNPVKDSGLINYLAKHGHISPFFHQRFIFKIERNLNETSDVDFNEILNDETLTMGLIMNINIKSTYIQHSFYGWVNLIKRGALSDRFTNRVLEVLKEKMPISSQCYFEENELNELNDSKKAGEFIEENDLPDKLKSKFKTITYRLTMPIFVARQMFTHRRFATNEISRRYVSDTPSFFKPNVWRGIPIDGAKQGSSNKVVKEANGKNIDIMYNEIIDNALEMYSDTAGEVAPEQTRMMLPQSMNTQVIFTGSLQAWEDMLKLRLDPHTQKETRDLAKLIKDSIYD